MDPKPLDMTPEGWTDVAGAYDKEIAPFLEPYAERALDLADVQAGARVLDVAAGSGALALAAARRGLDVVATDFASGMVERLRERAALEKPGNLTAAVMDGQALDFADASFDAVFSNFGVMFFPDRVTGFSEMHRVLKPGGRAAVTTWGAPERQDFFLTFMRAVKAVAPDLPPPPRPPTPLLLADPELLESEMRKGGFREVRLETSKATWELPAPEVYWESIQRTNPVFPALTKQLGEERLPRLRETVVNDLRQRFGDGPVRLEGEANVAVGVKSG